MSSLHNQFEYWNSVANSKVFTHPLDLHLLSAYFRPEFKILDYGCGYGRIANELYAEGYHNVLGVDSAIELVKRGASLHPQLRLSHIDDEVALDRLDGDYDAVILFAVLTCIPSNTGQQTLIQKLSSRLRSGGLLYISDYYIQKDKEEVKRYEYLENDPENYGVFTLAEGATFRHHRKDWIRTLLQDFEIVLEKSIPVKTMNGHSADAFQLLARK